MADYIYVHIPVCEEAVNNEETFSSFKKDGRFTTILEHTREDFSHQFMSQAIDIYPQFLKTIDWNLIKQNDNFGGAYKVDYPELSDIVKLDDYIFSPSTVAYVFKALDILNHIKSSKLNDVRILEIGAGYGGQCKIILDLAELFDIKIKDYTLIDLYWPSQLQKKYLTTLGYVDKINFVNFESLINLEDSIPEFDYLISIYALGEFNQDIQQFYIDKMPGLKYYYILWNSLPVHSSFLSSDIEDESPRTGPYNVLIKSKVTE